MEFNIKQRIIVYLISILFGLVLFNTTYMSLGTIVPLIVMTSIIVISLNTNNRVHTKKHYQNFIVYLFIVTIATVLSGGSDFRTIAKLLLTVLTLIFATRLSYSRKETKFLSQFFCLAYAIYAALVIHSIGMTWRDYGRIQILILNGSEALDPNVISATFILPMVISFYNVLYGKRKLIALFLILLFTIAILACGSRGAFVGFVIASLFLLLQYVKDVKRETGLWSYFKNFILLTSILFVVIKGIDVISQQDGVVGLNRVLDFEDESGNGRIPIWKERLSLVLESPLWGQGINRDLGTYGRGTACHNTFLEILYYGGMIGFMLFMKPIYQLWSRKTISKPLKYSLFLAVCIPIFFIDTLQERTLWNFLILFDILTASDNPEENLIW